MCSLTERKSRKAALLAAAVALSALLAAPAGCAPEGRPSGGPESAPQEQPAEDVVTVTIPTRVVNLAHQGLDDLVSDLRTAGEGHYESIEWGGTEGVDHFVTIELRESDRQWWAEKSEGYVGDAIELFAGIGEQLDQTGYKLEVGDDYRSMSAYYNLVPDPDIQVIPCLFACEYYSVMRQLFTGDGDGAWFMSIAIYNSDTGKLVTDFYTGDEVTSGELVYTQEDWDRSYEQ